MWLVANAIRVFWPSSLFCTLLVLITPEQSTKNKNEGAEVILHAAFLACQLTGPLALVEINPVPFLRVKAAVGYTLHVRDPRPPARPAFCRLLVQNCFTEAELALDLAMVWGRHCIGKSACFIKKSDIKF